MIRQISILDAILSLKPEYLSYPIIISSPDENVDTAETVITWGGATPISNSDIKAEQTRLQAEYDALAWKRNRQSEYPSVLDCIHALLDGGDTLTDLQAARQAVKDKYPKG